MINFEHISVNDINFNDKNYLDIDNIFNLLNENGYEVTEINMSELNKYSFTTNIDNIQMRFKLSKNIIINKGNIKLKLHQCVLCKDRQIIDTRYHDVLFIDIDKEGNESVPCYYYDDLRIIMQNEYAKYYIDYYLETNKLLDKQDSYLKNNKNNISIIKENDMYIIENNVNKQIIKINDYVQLFKKQVFSINDGVILRYAYISDLWNLLFENIVEMNNEEEMELFFLNKEMMIPGLDDKYIMNKFERAITHFLNNKDYTVQVKKNEVYDNTCNNIYTISMFRWRWDYKINLNLLSKTPKVTDSVDGLGDLHMNITTYKDDVESIIYNYDNINITELIMDIKKIFVQFYFLDFIANDSEPLYNINNILNKIHNAGFKMKLENNEYCDGLCDFTIYNSKYSKSFKLYLETLLKENSDYDIELLKIKYFLKHNK